MDEHSHTEPPSAPALRIKALESLLVERGLVDPGAVDEIIDIFEKRLGPRNGAKVVAHAWADPAYKNRLLEDGSKAIAELGFTGLQGEDMVVLENTPDLQNVICCTLCSCTAFTIIGLPPGWYKDFEYRSRVVRQSRTVLREMGLDLPDAVRIKVWDTTADTRYMVLPVQPPESVGWPEDKLAAVVTKESMIGVARLEAPYR